MRGAALGLAYAQDALGEDQDARDAVMAVLRAMPPRDALGDFLYGLFACARALATEDDAIVRAVHVALQSLGDEDFLLALPALRAAFADFPPRERGAIAERVAPLLGLPPAQRGRLLQLGPGAQALLDAKRIEAQALAWASAHGVLA